MRLSEIVHSAAVQSRNIFLPEIVIYKKNLLEMK